MLLPSNKVLHKAANRRSTQRRLKNNLRGDSYYQMELWTTRMGLSPGGWKLVLQRKGFKKAFKYLSTVVGLVHAKYKVEKKARNKYHRP